MKIIESKEEYSEVLNSNEYVFVDFYADWCGPCKMVGPVVEKLSQSNTDVHFVKVNVDHVPEVAQMYGIMSIPTLIVLKNGEPVSKQVGFASESDLQELINKAK
jgi:thioredoxin 1